MKILFQLIFFLLVACQGDTPAATTAPIQIGGTWVTVYTNHTYTYMLTQSQQVISGQLTTVNNADGETTLYQVQGTFISPNVSLSWWRDVFPRCNYFGVLVSVDSIAGTQCNNTSLNLKRQ